MTADRISEPKPGPALAKQGGPRTDAFGFRVWSPAERAQLRRLVEAAPVFDVTADHS